MSSEHINTRNKLKSIPKVATFMELLDSCTLSDEDKQIVKMYYLQNKSIGYIADILGYSESNIKKRHNKIFKQVKQINLI